VRLVCPSMESPASEIMSLSGLRADVFERDQGCVWPECRLPISIVNPLELAHLEPRGMGGRPSTNTPENTVIMCRFHHSLLDGRTHEGLKRELITLLKAYLREVSPLGMSGGPQPGD